MPEAPFVPPLQPLELCNYTRYNDVEVAPTINVDHPVPNDYDSYGHYVRKFTFPRPYAVYRVDRNEDFGLTSAGCGRLFVGE